MIRGFGILEMLIAVSLGLGVLTVIIAHSTEAARVNRKINGNQERLEAIFHTVDAIKSDLSKCGMRLQEARLFCGIVPFAAAADSFTCAYGVADEQLLEGAVKGQKMLQVAAGEFFKKGKEVLICDPAHQIAEANEIAQRLAGSLALKHPLRNDFGSGSAVVALKRVEYKYFPARHLLKRRSDKGNFQPLLEAVSDFYVAFFPDTNSVLYRIEVDRKEQVRGYVFLLNLV